MCDMDLYMNLPLAHQKDTADNYTRLRVWCLSMLGVKIQQQRQ